MEYHEPAGQWLLYDLHDFEGYCREFVIKGRFHVSVPKEVVDDYKLAEHMMGYAYYYPPLYDEAYSKMLRIVEMAVKMRCEQLGINTTTHKQGKRRIKKLADLIADLTQREPVKGLGDLLHKLREARNAYMHASIDSDQGGLLRARMRRCVVLLNVLFIDEGYFVQALAYRVAMMDRLDAFKDGTFSLGIAGRSLLAEAVLLSNAHYTAAGWVYCLHVATVPTDGDTALAGDYPAWEVFHVRDMNIDSTGVRASIAETGKPLTILSTDHPAALERRARFHAALDEVSEQDQQIAAVNVHIHLNISGVKFGYEWLWKVEAI